MRHIENLFFPSFPELKGQLTSNLIESIRVTCRSKVAKIFSIGNLGHRLENLFFTSPEPKGGLTYYLVGSTGETCS